MAGRRFALLVAGVTILCAGTAYGAFVGLPSNGTQVNNDGSAIDPRQNVERSDLTAGSLTAGAARVPWITLAQPAAGGGANQIFVRAFKSGAWQDEGFPESLNVEPSQSADSPSIDFTGAGRAVPWVAWAEESPSPGLGARQIFASRFAPSAGQNGGQWAHEGRGREVIPSLNINTSRNADLPALIGGTTVAGNNPVPWVTWEEFDGEAGVECKTTPGNLCAPQIFVSHAVPVATGTCTKPAGSGISGHNFCFQQVGLDRVQGPGAALDPSLNIDPTRSGIEADIAFTGPNDSVPWVVWYENSDSNGKHPSQLGLQDEDMVFAAKAVADAAGDGGFHWQVVGLGTAGQTNLLDNSGATHKFGPCAESIPAENGCSLNVTPGNNLSEGNGGENPSITAGTMVAGNNTTPWISWDENSSNGGQHSIFVARLNKAGDHYDLLNNGQPISHSGFNSTRSDIVFAGNTPYVSWHETNGSGQTFTVVGHFEGNPANPVFHIDTPGAGIGTTPPPAGESDERRAPIASTCPGDPFTGDGSACTGGAVGTPFFAFVAGTSPQSLFSQAYVPGPAQTGTATGVGQTTATVAGAANTDGAPTRVHFDFGTTAAYGLASAPQLLPPAAGTTTPVSAPLTGLSAGTVIHYRVVAQTDFGTAAGADATFTTAPAFTPPVLTNVKQSNRVWRAGKRLATLARKHRRKVPVGTKFFFTVNQQAKVRFAFTQQLGGRKVRGRCVARTKRNRRKRFCRRTVTPGVLSFTAHSGSNTVSFQGRISARTKLRPGRYTLVITATNAAGQSSAPARLSFTIVK